MSIGQNAKKYNLAKVRIARIVIQYHTTPIRSVLGLSGTEIIKGRIC